MVKGGWHLLQYRRREVDAGHRFEDLSAESASTYNYLTAVDDINAPDMYIPLMAAITYTLLVGLFTVCSWEVAAGDGIEFGWSCGGPQLQPMFYGWLRSARSATAGRTVFCTCPATVC